MRKQEHINNSHLPQESGAVESPERIWFDWLPHTPKCASYPAGPKLFHRNGIEYIRADIAEKAIAEAVEATKAAIEQIIEET